MANTLNKTVSSQIAATGDVFKKGISAALSLRCRSSISHKKAALLSALLTLAMVAFVRLCKASGSAAFYSCSEAVRSLDYAGEVVLPFEDTCGKHAVH